MRDDFSFTCPNPKCEAENSVNRTSSGEPIPSYDDEPKEFYVTCGHCFGVFKIEYIVVVGDVMFSNK